MTDGNPTDAEVAWAAGLFEGEGCTSLVRRPFGKGNSQMSLSLATTDEDVLRRFHEIVGVGFISGPVQRNKPGCKPFWTWRCSAQTDAHVLIETFRPWLGKRRREQATRVADEVARLRAERHAEHCLRGTEYRAR